VLLFAGLALAHRTWKTHEFFRPELLFSRFPAEDAMALSMDVAALRKSGLLDSKAPAEPDYKAFVDGTGFDYRRDLDTLAASFSKTGNYFIARGRFDFDRLRAYAVRQGGSCFDSLCRVQGSQPERRISFLPLRSDTLALAGGVSADSGRHAGFGEIAGRAGLVLGAWGGIASAGDFTGGRSDDGFRAGECGPGAGDGGAGSIRNRGSSGDYLPVVGRCEGARQPVAVDYLRLEERVGWRSGPDRG
jgi:hypothetical protein